MAERAWPMLAAARACMRALTLAAFQFMYAVANAATACWACAAAVLTCSGGGGGDGYSCVVCACWSFAGGRVAETFELARRRAIGDGEQPRAIEQMLDAAGAVVGRRQRGQRQPMGAAVDVWLADDLVAGGDDRLDGVGSAGRRRRESARQQLGALAGGQRPAGGGTGGARCVRAGCG